MRYLYLSPLTLMISAFICMSSTIIAQNVGIGEASPTVKLDIKGTNGNDLLNIQDDNSNSRLYVKENGETGIGTTSPLGRLEVEGDDQNNSLSETTLTLDADYADVGIDNLHGPVLRFRGNNATFGAISGVVGTPSYISDWPGGLAFHTKTDNDSQDTMTERVRLDYQGHFGIGTKAPQTQLHVSGGHLRIDDTKNIRFYQSGTERVRIETSPNNDLQFYTGALSEAMRIEGNGDVGIGTPSPSANLHVDGSMRNDALGGSGNVLVQADDNGNLTKKNYSGNGNEVLTGNGSWTDVANLSDNDWTRNSGKLYPATLSDDVGIGTNDPKTQLHLSGGHLRIDDTKNIRFFQNGTERANIRSTPSNDLQFHTGAISEAMRIEGSGHVGIGTTSPKTSLHIGGHEFDSPDDKGRVLNFYNTTEGEINRSNHRQVIVTNTTNTSQPKRVGLSLYNHNSTDNIYSPMLAFGALSTSGGFANESAAITAYNQENSSDNNFRLGDLIFYTQGSGRGLTEKMRIQYDGNVGIGTPNPGKANLEVEAQSNERGFHIEGNWDGKSGHARSLVVKNNGHTSGAAKYKAIQASSQGDDPSSGRTQAIFAKAEGRDWNAAVHGLLDNDVYDPNTSSNQTSGTAVFGEDKNCSYPLSDLTDERYAGYFVGDVKINGNLNSSASCSDRRLKKNIEQYKSALDKLNSLQAYTYHFKDKERIQLPKGKQYGFIAQEVEEVFPHLVIDSLIRDNNAAYKGIEKERFVPILAQAIKEQQDIIEQEQQKNDSLKQQVKLLKQKGQQRQQRLQSQQQQIEELKEAVHALKENNAQNNFKAEQ